MKKLKLKLQNFEEAEMLTREQLKTVIGGEGSGEAKECSVSSKCYNWAGQEEGSVSCKSDKGPCKRGTEWVECEGEKTTC